MPYCSSSTRLPAEATVVTDRRAKWKGVDGKLCPCSPPPPERACAVRSEQVKLFEAKDAERSADHTHKIADLDQTLATMKQESDAVRIVEES